jgi:uncharacterized protein YfaA (DUF2138 family)
LPILPVCFCDHQYDSPVPKLVATLQWAAVRHDAAAHFLFLNQTICRNTALSIMLRSAKEIAERRVQEKLDGAMALIEYQTQEQATRLLTAKLRAERLARESKPHGSERHS